MTLPTRPDRPDPARPALDRPALPRRTLLGRAWLLMPWAALAGCASTWPPVPAGGGSSSARQRLGDSAEAHGAAAWAALKDVNLAVEGLGAAIGGQAGGRSAPAQLRWLPATGVMAWQSASAAQPADPAPRLTMWRRWSSHNEQRAWRNGVPVSDASTLADAAQQADLLRLLWLGPAAWVDHPGVVNWAEPQTLDGRRCDHLHLTGAQALGGAAPGRMSLFIDRDQGWLRRLRVSVDGAGAGDDTVEIDLAEHRRLHGVLWPLRCQVNRPRASLGSAPATWRLTGLDVNRGLQAGDISGPVWSGGAAAPAQALAPG